MTEDGYSLERRGSIAALKGIGLTLEQSVGRRFTFYMEDENEQGCEDAIMFNGTVVKDSYWGYLAVHDKPP